MKDAVSTSSIGGDLILGFATDGAVVGSESDMSSSMVMPSSSSDGIGEFEIDERPADCAGAALALEESKSISKDKSSALWTFLFCSTEMSASPTLPISISSSKASSMAAGADIPTGLSDFGLTEVVDALKSERSSSKLPLLSFKSIMPEPNLRSKSSPSVSGI